ncbi:endonuclease/exonuclease/phosphatase family protein [Demequina zhanjiangensis]|uniref:Endonuclease/exonuclease/phosphatase family protein n=1 Tax=Demequina zhanjiangensis TaxID=3051659 RepID=A0ABT8FYC9_9MICO|nr:endonuclease/exonuclease/phosphatase family protein [Demequina sp. SYSU T00b26]MDN4471454.1 endonuclease/exonuclease/phosphatase family protein [Demequina sp. SYSU T00b26]
MDQGEQPSERADAKTERPRTERAPDLVLAVAALALMVPWLARLTGYEPGPLTYLVALTPWFTLAWLVLALVAGLTRRWTMLGTVALPTVVSIGWASTMFIGASVDPAEHETVTVATVNATFGRVDADAVVALVEEYDVDVLAVQELTPDVFEALEAAGLSARLPEVNAWPADGFDGTGLWTRLPVAEPMRVDGFVSKAVHSTVTIGGDDITILAAHPAAPGVQTHRDWDADLALLETVASSIEGPAMIVGDLNATRDHPGFRRLEDAGFRDAADDAGAGFVPTFPEGRLPFPVVAIDHVMARDVDWAAASVETVSLSGADHRALVVTYAID